MLSTSTMEGGSGGTCARLVRAASKPLESSPARPQLAWLRTVVCMEGANWRSKPMSACPAWFLAAVADYVRARDDLSGAE